MSSDARDVEATTASPERSATPIAQSLMLPEKREGDWRQWVIVPTLIFSDLLLTSLLWGLALVLYGIWGPKTLLVGPVIACVLASTVVWMGLRSLLGLYPGYGLGSAEELRRQTYATFATLGVTTIFAFAFSVAPYFSRLLLGIGFLGLLFAPPLVRHIVKWGLARAGMWGKLAVIFGASESGRQLVHTLKEEWGVMSDNVASYVLVKERPRNGQGTLAADELE